MNHSSRDEVDLLSKDELFDEKAALEKQVADLKKEVHSLQIERDVLKTAAEIIKKDQGIRLQTLTNREKAIVIDALRDKYSLNELLVELQMAKSSYCYQKNAMQKPDQYTDIRVAVKKVFSESYSWYGSRRIHSAIKADGTTISEKVIRRIMKEEQLAVPCKKTRKYSSYKGEITPAVPNVIERDFHAQEPNTKWRTDISEFPIPAGKIYLSPIMDCFDGLPVSWTIGTSPDAELVNTMLDKAISIHQCQKRAVHRTTRHVRGSLAA